MNTILIKGEWHILKGKLKQTWALLTDDRLEYREGRAEECLGRIQKKAGEKRAAINRTMRECEKLRQQIDQALSWLSSANRPEVHSKEPCCCL